MTIEFINFLARWGHVLFGIVWIGMLYYFNFVQIPNMPNIPDEQKPAIGKVIAPAALFWFRWGAMDISNISHKWKRGTRIFNGKEVSYRKQ